MSATARWTKLAEKLLREDAKSNLDWRSTVNEREFQTLIGRFIIEIDGEDLNHFVNIRLRNEGGKVIDTFNSHDLEEDPFETENWEQRLRRLLDKIHRDLSGADDALDEVIRLLDI